MKKTILLVIILMFFGVSPIEAKTLPSPLIEARELVIEESAEKSFFAGLLLKAKAVLEKSSKERQKEADQMSANIISSLTAWLQQKWQAVFVFLSSLFD
ncbi:MAG: hypothetical protein M1514_01950 [Patescibacteria group bacterium]|nr:hypothetical protein [Patescibacteria group bacterium]